MESVLFALSTSEELASENQVCKQQVGCSARAGQAVAPMESPAVNTGPMPVNLGAADCTLAPAALLKLTCSFLTFWGQACDHVQLLA